MNTFLFGPQWNSVVSPKPSFDFLPVCSALYTVQPVKIKKCASSSVIIWMRADFRKTVVGDWHFDYLSSSHLQSQVKSLYQMMVFIPLFMVFIGQFGQEVIGHQDLKGAVTGYLLFYCCFQSCFVVYGTSLPVLEPSCTHNACYCIY